MLIDVYALVYRAFFALPPLTSPDGKAVNAVYGFERMLNRMLGDERPTHVVACFDAGVPAERLSAVPEYKANRPETPDDLSSQFPLVRRILDAYGIPIVEVEGEEADDVIATLASRASRDGLRTIIVSGDLDLLQLVDPHVTVVVTRRGISDLARYDETAVRERYGLAPAQLPDYRGLKGDASDNLAGVPGIGEKTAVKLIAQYGTLDNLLAHADEVTPKRVADLLASHVAQARACRDVSTAKRGLPVALTWDQAEYKGGDAAARNAVFSELGFRSLLARLPGKAAQTDAGGTRAASVIVAGTPGPTATSRDYITPTRLGQMTAVHASPAIMERVTATGEYRLASGRDDALEMLARARSARELALCALPELRSWRDAEPVAFALASEAGMGDVIPAPLALADAEVRGALSAVLGAESPSKIVHGLKPLTGWLGAHGFKLAGVELDTQLAHALLAEQVDPTLEETLDFAGSPLFVAVERNQPAMDLFATPDRLEPAHASAADVLLRASTVLQARIDAGGMTRLLRDIEQPLAPVLAAMERAGFRLNLDELARIRGHLERVMNEASAAIYALAGGEFNINSPKALGDVLFEKLKLQHRGKTKTGYATGSDVLAPLAREHEIAAKVLEFREVSKLKSTYVDALPALLESKTGLLHTTLHQIGAATGRPRRST